MANWSNQDIRALQRLSAQKTQIETQQQEIIDRNRGNKIRLEVAVQIMRNAGSRLKLVTEAGMQGGLLLVEGCDGFAFWAQLIQNPAPGSLLSLSIEIGTGLCPFYSLGETDPNTHRHILIDMAQKLCEPHGIHTVFYGRSEVEVDVVPAGRIAKVKFLPGYEAKTELGAEFGSRTVERRFSFIDWDKSILSRPQPPRQQNQGQHQNQGGGQGGGGQGGNRRRNRGQQNQGGGQGGNP